MELANYSHLNKGAQSTQQYNFPNPNLRLGLTNTTEIEFAWLERFSQTVSQPGSASQTTSGFGDTNLRFKKNMLGNDGGPFAWALMPGVKIPTNSNGLGNKKWEPYLMIPLAVTLPNQWAISLMPELDVRKNNANDGYHTEFNSPFTIGHHLFKIFDGYGEFVSHSSNDVNAVWTNYLGTGITARVGPNTQLDVGCNFGLNSLSPSVNPFAGYVYRY
jgi:hypothetical protein